MVPNIKSATALTNLNIIGIWLSTTKLTLRQILLDSKLGKERHILIHSNISTAKKNKCLQMVAS